jgi:hypothetical protein
VTAPSAFSFTTFGLLTRFGFGLADCSGTGVELSSAIGAGKRCAVRSSAEQIKQNRPNAHMFPVKTYLAVLVL